MKFYFFYSKIFFIGLTDQTTSHSIVEYNMVNYEMRLCRGAIDLELLYVICVPSKTQIRLGRSLLKEFLINLKCRNY